MYLYLRLKNVDRLLNQNKACFQAFLQEIYLQISRKAIKYSLDVSSSTLLHQNLTLI